MTEKEISMIKDSAFKVYNQGGVSVQEILEATIKLTIEELEKKNNNEN